MGLVESLRAVVGQFGSGGADYAEIYRDGSRQRPQRVCERDATPLAFVRPPRIEFSVVTPQDFDDAQQIADRLRADSSVIVDLQSCDPDLSKRLTDFCSGLTYALEGSLQYIGGQVVLLAPYNVGLSSEAPSALQERRFFNQT